MRTALLTLVLVGIVLAPLARADLEVGSHAPDIEAKEWLDAEGTLTGERIPSLSDLRGMVVVLFFWVSFHSGGERIMPVMNIVSTSPYLGRTSGIEVIGLTDAGRKAVEESIKREKVFFPVGVQSEAHKDYEIESFPRVVIVDPDGKVAWTGWPGNADEMVKAIREVIAKTPPRMTHSEEAERCRADLDDACTAIRKQEWRAAFRASRAAFERAVSGDPLKTYCQDMLDLVEALGREQIGDVDQLIDDEDYEQAVAILRQVRRQFRGLDVSGKAKQRLRSLAEEHEEVAALLQDRQDDVAAADLYLEARKWAEKRQLGRACRLLEEILNEFDETLAAEYAERMIDRMEQNPAVMVHVRDYKAERDCKAWISQARTYKAHGRYDKARELLQRVIDDYGDTKWAEVAERELINLP